MEYLNSEEVDFAAYLKATETQEKIREARVYLEKLKNDLLNPKVVTKITMPWRSMLNQFDFKAGEVTLYAGGNGGGKSLITGQIALGLIKQGEKVCIMSFEMKPKRTLMRMTRQFSGQDLDNLFKKHPTFKVYLIGMVISYLTKDELNIYLENQKTINKRIYVLLQERLKSQISLL